MLSAMRVYGTNACLECILATLKQQSHASICVRLYVKTGYIHVEINFI